MAKITKAQEQVQLFVSACKKYGFDWVVVSDNVIRISRFFEANNKSAFSDCDMTYGYVLGLAPLRGGSVWGTDGGSVGGQVGLQNGHFLVNKSGTSARFIKELRLTSHSA